MKFSPTVAEMAEMSPMCSIMEATAMGAITRMADRSNLATLPEKSVKKGCRPKMGFSPPSRVLPDRPVKSTMPASRAAT